MNTITQLTIFDYCDNTDFGDLYRLKVLFDHIPAENLIDALDKDRKNGRNDFTNLSMLKAILVKFVFQLSTVEDLRRELSRNPILRKICGFNDDERKLHRFVKNHKIYTGKLIPGANVFSAFIKRLENHEKEVDAIFQYLLKELFEKDDEFGKGVAGDGKYFDSYAKSDHESSCIDNRKEKDATWSTKEYRYRDASGTLQVKKEHHYGFRKHTLIDVKTELPIASIVTPANVDEKKVMIKLLEQLPKELLERIDYGTFDRGYDSSEFLNLLRNKGILPVIDKRNMRKGDVLQEYQRNSHIYYTESGEVFYYDESIENSRIDKETGQPSYFQRMKYEGYDKNRKAIRYSYKGHVYRLYIKDEPRIFNEIARDSNKFERYYNTRSGVERYHGRLDRDLSFENHTIRGLKKMTLMTKLADIILLAFGVAHYEKGQTNYASIYAF